jgi:hypothetical protein
MRGDLRSAAGKTVARGAGKGGLVGVGAEGFGKHASNGCGEGDALRCGLVARKACGAFGHKSGCLGVTEQGVSHDMDCRGLQREGVLTQGLDTKSLRG